MRLSVISLDNLNLTRNFFYLAVLTISFDIFMVLHIGFNFRAAQIFMILPIILGLFIPFRCQELRWPIGFFNLLAFIAYILIFIPNTHYLPRSIGYGFWLIFNAILIFATVQLFSTYEKVIQLLRWYLFSFFIIALFGGLQFILPLLKVSAPLVVQWWIPGVLPRVNGFSYEPSYFATYMLIGFVLSGYLLEKKSSLITPKYLKIIFFTITLAIILSSSRMGIFMMFLWFLRHPALFFYRLIKGRINRRFLGYSLLLFSTFSLLIILTLSDIGKKHLIFLLMGTGIGETSSHSLDARMDELRDTIQIFLDSPFIGYSLGGISAAIANLRGTAVTSLEIAKENEGMSVFAEVLAAGGIIGFIPFCLYVGTLLIKPLRLARRLVDSELKKLLVGMVLSLIFEFIILQFNQNILRPYIWLHIAMLSVVYSIGIKIKKGEIIEHHLN